MAPDTPRALPPAWERTKFEGGVATYRLKSWSAFNEFLETHVFKDHGGADHRFIWRGHRRSDWELNSSLDRLLDPLPAAALKVKSLEQRSQEHLEEFKYAARGRRGLNPPTMGENDWWALGQHFGLATPLLDWSRSPYAAAYFAFEERDDATDYRIVFGLDRDAVHIRNASIVEEHTGEDRPNILELIDPLSDENPRLVSQGALFTRAPLAVPVDVWVQVFFGDTESEILLQLEIPDGDRNVMLARSRPNEHQSSFVVSRSDRSVARRQLANGAEHASIGEVKCRSSMFRS